MADKDAPVSGGRCWWHGNTRVALARGTTIIAGTTERFRNADHSGLETVLAEYLSKHRSLPARAAIALAGPVRGDCGAMTNLGWSMQAGDLARMTGIRQVALLNDLQAQGHALPYLAADHLRVIRDGTPEGGTRLVIGLGTGVNAAPVYPAGHGFVVPPAEAGHIHLPQQTEEDQHLARWLCRAARLLHRSRMCWPGRGFWNGLYAYHAEQAGGAQARDASAIMTAMAEGDALAMRTGRHYVRLLAQYTADLALTTLPFGGIYYIGGVARAFTPFMARFGYDAAFTDMGRFSDLVAQFPVALVEDDFAALTGCAVYLAA